MSAPSVRAKQAGGGWKTAEAVTVDGKGSAGVLTVRLSDDGSGGAEGWSTALAEAQIEAGDLANETILPGRVLTIVPVHGLATYLKFEAADELVKVSIRSTAAHASLCAVTFAIEFSWRCARTARSGREICP